MLVGENMGEPKALTDKQGKVIGVLTGSEFTRREYSLYNDEAIAAMEKYPYSAYNDLNLRKINTLSPLVRDIHEKIVRWKEKYAHNTMLFLTGCTKVGKEKELLRFAYANYERVVIVPDLDKVQVKRFVRLIQTVGAVETMKRYCRRFNMVDYVDDETTVIVFEELNKNPIMYSVLPILIKTLKCQKMGYTQSYYALLNSKHRIDDSLIHRLELCSLSFREYCQSLGKEEIRQHIIDGSANDYEVNTFQQMLSHYLELGGMPGVVEALSRDDNSRARMFHLCLFSHWLGEVCEINSPNGKTLLSHLPYTVSRVMCTYGMPAEVDLFHKIVLRLVHHTNCEADFEWFENVCLCLLYDNCLKAVSADKSTGDTWFNRFCKRIYFMDVGAFKEMSSTHGKDELYKFEIVELFAFNEFYRFLLKYDNIFDIDSLVCYPDSTCVIDFKVTDKNGVTYGVLVTSPQVCRTLGYAQGVLRRMKEKGVCDIPVILSMEDIKDEGDIPIVPIYAIWEKFPIKV